MELITLGIGSLAGFIGGSLGTSGSSIMIPGLLATGVASNYKTAAGTTLLAILAPLSIGAVYVYWKAGHVQVMTALLLVISYFIASTISAKLTLKYFSDKQLLLGYAIYLAVVSIYTFYRWVTFDKKTSIEAMHT
jgi:uncharacterized membrane protein YfcA